MEITPRDSVWEIGFANFGGSPRSGKGRGKGGGGGLTGLGVQDSVQGAAALGSWSWRDN